MARYDLEWTIEMIGPDLPDAVYVEIMIDYDFRGGCHDYFAGGCWNPGDPDEIEITGICEMVHVGPGPLDFRRDALSLLPAEEERVLTYIAENPPGDDYDDWEDR